jgi:hypothetical protein
VNSPHPGPLPQGEGITGVLKMAVDSKIEKELDGALVCAEMLRACPDSRGDLGRTACPASILMGD